MDIKRYLSLKYPDGFNFRDVLTDETLQSYFPEGYLPRIEGKLEDSSIFLQIHQRISGADGLFSAYNVYIRPDGVIANYFDSSYVQMPSSLKGFIARFTIPVPASIPNNLDLEYLIPLNNVPHRIVSDVRADLEGDKILSSEVLVFDSIDISKYPGATFDDRIVKWMDNREELCSFFGII